MSAHEVAHAAKLEVQLTELANLRHELQNLYNHATNELNAQRKHAATYKAQADAATAQNAALRKWNLQLAEELSLLTDQLHSATGGDADSSLAADATASSLSREHEAVVGSLVALRDSGSDVERRAAQKLIARLVSTGSGALLDAVERHTNRATRAEVSASAAASAPSAADEASTSALVGQQQALLELASLSVRYVALKSRVEHAERSARTDSERSELLERSAREMLGDLSEASRKISSLEARISPLVEEHARLEAEAKEASRRATNAQRVVVRAGERHAELAAAVNALTGENRSLRNENLSLRQVVHDLGASEAEVTSVVRASQATWARAGGAAREMEVTSVPTQNRRPAEVQPSSRQGSSPISELGEAEPMLGLRYLQERLERVRGEGARSSVSGAASAEVESPAFSAAY